MVTGKKKKKPTHEKAPNQNSCATLKGKFLHFSAMRKL